jgi:hypothetical protein
VARLATPSQGVRRIAGPLTEGPGPTSRPRSLPAPRVACRYSPVGLDRQQIATRYFPYKSLGLYVLGISLNGSIVLCKLICWQIFMPETLFKSFSRCKSKPTALIPAVAEPPELFRLKCANDHYATLIISTHFKRNNPLVCRVSARYNHGSIGLKQAYLARRGVYNHRPAHQLLIYRYSNIITNQVSTQVNLYKPSLN